MGAILAALTCYAAVGSIISSFRISGPGFPPYGNTIYRDPGYVYSLVYNSWSATKGWDYHLRRYTPTGSLVREVDFYSKLNFRDDGDRCHLGAGYFVVAGGEDYALYIMSKNNGSVARRIFVSGPGGGWPDNITWDGRYYIVGSYRAPGKIRLYLPSGAFGGNRTVRGWPSTLTTVGGMAFAHRVRGKGGNYLVVSHGYSRPQSYVSAAFDLNKGTLVATWTMPPEYVGGAVYGDSSRPAAYGAAYWTQHLAEDGLWAYEVDLGARGAHGVVPASLGLIKAIYR